MRRLLVVALLGTLLLTSTACSLFQPRDTVCGSLPIAACSPLPPHAADTWPEGLVLRATSYVEGGSITQFVAGTALTVTVGPEYELTVDAGCNTLSVSAHIEDEDRLVADEFASTAIGCLDDRAAQDAWIVDFFEADPRWSFDGSELTLATATVSIELSEVHAVPVTPLG
jgi:hypothetical protein